MNTIKILFFAYIVWIPTDGFSANDNENKATQHQIILDILAEDEADQPISFFDIKSKVIVLDIDGNLIIEKTISISNIQDSEFEDTIILLGAEFLMENNGDKIYLATGKFNYN